MPRAANDRHRPSWSACETLLMEKINLTQKFRLFSDYWSPQIVGELNDSHVKLAKLKGEFV